MNADYDGGSADSVEFPDSDRAEVLVLDMEHLRRIPLPLPHPERVVLIAGNRTADLEQAWIAGLESVVLRDDPISMAVLAILCARLRHSGAVRRDLGQKA